MVTFDKAEKIQSDIGKTVVVEIWVKSGFFGYTFKAKVIHVVNKDGEVYAVVECPNGEKRIVYFGSSYFRTV
jgi:hypothetical protein